MNMSVQVGGSVYTLLAKWQPRGDTGVERDTGGEDELVHNGT